ncbi:hypothetical protein QYG89_10080 [Bacillus sp. B190/17]|uniref:DUF4340 domain-containing protein n=1 Tax=Bacillus lumedeiriae TaxID=3058829 RepID=A0ABW8IA04_9BACI
MKGVIIAIFSTVGIVFLILGVYLMADGKKEPGAVKDSVQHNEEEEVPVGKNSTPPKSDTNKTTHATDPKLHTLPDFHLLEELSTGNLMGILQIGTSKDELIRQFGKPLKEYVRNEDILLEYEDVIYTISPNNGLNYAAELKPVHSSKYNFQEIKKALGDGDEHVSFEQGKDKDGLFYLYYASEDSELIFYSPSQMESPVTKIIYGNPTLYSLNQEEETTTVHPGEVEPIIKNIRAEYNAINSQISSMTKRDTLSMEGHKKQVFRNSRGIIKKVIEITPEGSMEYYYDDTETLFFIFFYKGRIENRFYFYQNQMIRWIDPSRAIIDYDQGQRNHRYKEWEEYWLRKGY